MTSTFDLVTVNWNQAQTNLWLRHVEKHCPGANVILVPDNKPYEWCWSSGKLCCFDPLPEVRHPGRFIYTDTDIICTRDFEEIFDLMGDAHIAMGSAIPSMIRGWSEFRDGQCWMRKTTDALFGSNADNPTIHYSSGFMALKDTDPIELGIRWKIVMEDVEMRRCWDRYRVYEEFALSYAVILGKYKIWDMPLEIHSNLLRNRHFRGNVEIPMAIHYHNVNRLKKLGLGGYLESTD